MNWFLIALIVYSALIIIHIILNKIFKVFKEDVSFWFFLVYMLLSIITLPFTILLILQNWYSNAELKQQMLEALYDAFQGEGYTLRSIKEAEKVALYLADNKDSFNIDEISFKDILDNMIAEGMLECNKDGEWYIK